MVDGTRRSDEPSEDGAPVRPLDAAAYIHEISGGMAIMAGEVGLDHIAETLRQAQRQAGEALARGRQSRNAAPDDAA